MRRSRSAEPAAAAVAAVAVPEEAPTEEPPGRGQPAVRVHLASEEWTRLVLESAALDAGAGHRLAARELAAGSVVWELTPGRIVVGAERDRAADAPGAPFRSARSTVLLEELAASPRPGAALTGRVEPQSALVTVAVDPGRRILVDLLAAGATSVLGADGDRRAFLGRLVAELAERRWSGLDRVVLAGFDPLGPQVRPDGELLAVAGPADALDLLEGEPGARSRAPRRRDEGAGRATLVVVGPGWDGEPDLERLALRCGARRDAGRPAAALVVAGACPRARAVVQVAAGGSRGEVFLAPLVTATSPTDAAPVPSAPADEGRGASAGVGAPAPAARLAHAAALAPAGSTCRAEGPAATRHAAREPAAARPGAGPREVEIALLGRVEVRGVDGQFARRPKLTELVAFLALHPEGASSSAWTTALWPGRRIPNQTAANRLSEARRFLGFADDERPRLRRDGERFRLAGVTTDWERFREASGPDADLATRRAAFGLVRGRPLEGLTSGTWTALELHVVEIERVVTDRALGLAEELLELGDADGAATVAHQGLRACPWDERLHRVLMRSADASGNRAGVEAILRHLALVLEIDGDPLGRIHPETAALYARLAGTDGEQAGAGASQRAGHAAR